MGSRPDRRPARHPRPDHQLARSPPPARPRHQRARPAGTPRYPKVAPADKPLLYASSRNYLDPAIVTLPEVLAKAGYSTGHFGKWHLGLAREHWPEKHGFPVAFHAPPRPGPPAST